MARTSPSRQPPQRVHYGPPNGGSSERAQPFQEWLQAIADLALAEARGTDDAERERLSAEINRARGAVALSLAP